MSNGDIERQHAEIRRLQSLKEELVRERDSLETRNAAIRAQNRSDMASILDRSQAMGEVVTELRRAADIVEASQAKMMEREIEAGADK